MNLWVIKMNKRIFAGLLLLVSISIYCVGFFITNSKINAIESAYSNTASTIALQEEARKIRVITEENAEEIEMLSKYFVPKGDEVVFIEDVESLAKNSGIKFDITSIAPIKVQGDSAESKEISVKMNIEGSWNSMISFFDGLEKLPFGISTQSFSLDKPSGASWKGSLEFLVFN